MTKPHVDEGEDGNDDDDDGGGGGNNDNDLKMSLPIIVTCV